MECSLRCSPVWDGMETDPTHRSMIACVIQAASWHGMAWHAHLRSCVQGKGKLAVTAFGDLWLHALAFLVLTVTIAIGIWQLIDGAAVVSPLLISILWAAYAAIPPFLLLLYSVTGHNFVMQFACKCAPLVCGSPGFVSGAMCSELGKRCLGSWVSLHGSNGSAMQSMSNDSVAHARQSVQLHRNRAAAAHLTRQACMLLQQLSDAGVMVTAVGATMPVPVLKACVWAACESKQSHAWAPLHHLCRRSHCPAMSAAQCSCCQVSFWLPAQRSTALQKAAACPPEGHSWPHSWPHVLRLPCCADSATLPASSALLEPLASCGPSRSTMPGSSAVAWLPPRTVACSTATFMATEPCLVWLQGIQPDALTTMAPEPTMSRALLGHAAPLLCIHGERPCNECYWGMRLNESEAVRGIPWQPQTR